MPAAAAGTGPMDGSSGSSGYPDVAPFCGKVLSVNRVPFSDETLVMIQLPDGSGRTVSYDFDLNPYNVYEGDYVEVYGSQRPQDVLLVNVEKPNHYIRNIKPSECFQTAVPPSTQTGSSTTTTTQTGGNQPPGGTGQNPPVTPPKGGKCGCFIATAVLPADTAGVAKLNVLRSFRDKVLLKSEAGTACVNYYYSVSPPIADFIAAREPARWLVRWAVVEPAVWVVSSVSPVWNN